MSEPFVLAQQRTNAEHEYAFSLSEAQWNNERHGTLACSLNDEVGHFDQAVNRHNRRVAPQRCRQFPGSSNILIRDCDKARLDLSIVKGTGECFADTAGAKDS